MVINARKEKLVPLTQAVDLLIELGLPTVHYETWRRWSVSGVHGATLETLRFGGRKYTTRAAVERFVAACNAGAT